MKQIFNSKLGVCLLFSSCLNCSKREKTFDFDGTASVSINYNPQSGSFSYSGGAGSNLIAPKSFKVKMYGAAKRNGVWHGSKLYVGID